MLLSLRWHHLWHVQHVKHDLGRVLGHRHAYPGGDVHDGVPLLREGLGEGVGVGGNHGGLVGVARGDEAEVGKLIR